jgi:hypothetical protein
MENESLKDGILNDFVIPPKLTPPNRVLKLDELIEYLTQVNEFLNHKQRPFRKIIDREMIL